MRLIVPDSSANFLVGMAKEKWKSLDAQRRDLRLPIKKETLEVLGFLIFLYSSETNNYIMITGGSFKGFLCHPRTFNSKGWNHKGELLESGPYVYPLVDDDHGTRGLHKIKNDWRVKQKPPENYGNLDWLGNKGKVLSFRGPAGRQFAMDSTISYPGFTEWDYTTYSGGSEVEHYTPYRNLIYRNGKVAQEFLYGYKVLGCGLRKGKIVSVVGVDYAGIPNPSGSTGGFYDEVYWGKERIGFRSSSRPSTPWFFNSTGTEAVNDNTKLSISDEGVCTFSSLTSGSGTQTNSQTIGTDDATWSMGRTGNFPQYFDYSVDTLQGITLNITGNDATTWHYEAETTNGDLPLMYSGDPPTVITVTGPNPAYEGAQYTADVNGDYCPDAVFTWDFSGGTISSSGEITEITGCGTETITATISGGGFSLSGSLEVMMPDGDWYLVSDEYMCSDWGTTAHEYVAGNLRYHEEGHHVVEFNLPYQYPNCPISGNPDFPVYYAPYWYYFKVYFRRIYEWRC